MSYGFCTNLHCFGELSPNARVKALQGFVDALTSLNELIFRNAGKVIPLYESGVRYRKDVAGNETQWYDACAVLSAGAADCKALAAYRAAELRFQGKPARAVVTTKNGQLFHVIVTVNGKDEDPSLILGMVTR